MPDCIIVEDHGDTREGYTEFLGTCGYTVRAAADAEGFWRLVEERVPEVVIMDLQLPAVDGWELTRRIRADPRTTSVPILVVSACVRDIDRARALAEGANAFLPKPCDLDQIVDTLARLTESAEAAPLSPEGEGVLNGTGPARRSPEGAGPARRSPEGEGG